MSETKQTKKGGSMKAKKNTGGSISDAPRLPKILFFDIENAPNLAYVWAKYEQNVIDYDKEWYLLSFAYKWLGDKSVKAFALPDFKTYKKDKTDDAELTKKLWELFNEADIIVGHNSDQFDIRKSNARFIFHGLKPPSPYKTVDTKKAAKRYFNFNSNKLNDLGKHFGIGEKVKHDGFELWLGCMNGLKSAWKTMIRYNKQDVILLEKIYHKLLPWITVHPNIGIYIENEVCTHCGSKHIQRRGLAVNKTTKYYRIQCMDCGAWMRSTKGLKITKPLVAI